MARDNIFGDYLFALPELALDPYPEKPTPQEREAAIQKAKQKAKQKALPVTGQQQVQPQGMLQQLMTQQGQAEGNPFASLPIDFDALRKVLSDPRATPAFYKFVFDTLSMIANIYNTYEVNQARAQQAEIAPYVNMYKALVNEQANLANIISAMPNQDIIQQVFLPRWAELESTKRTLLSRFPMLSALPVENQGTEQDNIQRQAAELLNFLNQR